MLGWRQLTESRDVPIDGSERVSQEATEAGHYSKSAETTRVVLWEKEISNISVTIIIVTWTNVHSSMEGGKVIK
jgi:hypothetical protein